MTPRNRLDADAALVRRTGVHVGLWVTVAAAGFVMLTFALAVAFVVQQVPLADLLNRDASEATVDVSGVDLFTTGIPIGILAIALAGGLGLLATRRAVAPIVDALARQRRFVADASHELRTPLAVLDARIQVLERAMAPDDPHRAVVDELRGDSLYVINIVNDLLDSVDLTAGGVALPVEIAPVIDDAVSSIALLAQERDISVVNTPVEPGLRAAIPSTSLQRALVALLDNAVKHSPPGATVTVEAGARKGKTWIAVRDHGAGIRGIDPDRIFDRFARSTSDHAARPGFGLGLSLVQDTLGRFGGTVAVTNTSEHGTTLTMELPRPRA